MTTTGSLLVRALILGAYAVVVGVATLFVMPVWTLVDAWRGPRLTSARKLTWSAVIVLAWPLGPFVYAAVSSESRALKRAAAATGIALCLLFAVAPLANRWGGEAGGALRRQAAEMVRGDALQGAAEEDRARVLREIDATAELKFGVQAELLMIIERLSRDAVLSREDVAAWESVYARRGEATEKELEAIRKTLDAEGFAAAFPKLAAPAAK